MARRPLVTASYCSAACECALRLAADWVAGGLTAHGCAMRERPATAAWTMLSVGRGMACPSGAEALRACGVGRLRQWSHHITAAVRPLVLCCAGARRAREQGRRVLVALPGCLQTSTAVGRWPWPHGPRQGWGIAVSAVDRWRLSTCCRAACGRSAAGRWPLPLRCGKGCGIAVSAAGRWRHKLLRCCCEPALR